MRLCELVCYMTAGVIDKRRTRITHTMSAMLTECEGERGGYKWMLETGENEGGKRIAHMNTKLAL